MNCEKMSKKGGKENTVRLKPGLRSWILVEKRQIKSTEVGKVSTSQSLIKLIFVSASHPTGFDNGSMTRMSIIVGTRGGEGLCWSSAYLVHCGPDEPSWTWNQIWVQAPLPNDWLNWTTRSSAIQAHSTVAQPKPVAIRPQVCLWKLTVQHWCQTVRWKASARSTVANQADICLCLLPDRTWHKVNDTKVDYSGSLWGERSGTSRGLNSAGLCSSSAHLVQCGSDEPSWTWTQIWVQVPMPKYSLNSTARSSAIQGWQRCQWCSLPAWRWPN